MKTKPFLALLLSLVLVVLFSSCMTPKDMVRTIKDMVRTIEVSGRGEVELTADIASFAIQVRELAPSTKEAQRLANQKVSAILSVLQRYEVADKDITTTSLTFRPSYRWIDNEQILEGQVASQSLTVTLRNLPSLGPVIDALGEISGITFNAVRFDKEDKQDAMTKAREKAVADALAKAEVYARSSDMRVGTPITISESSTPSTPYDVRGMKMMASESYDMATEIPAGTMTVHSTIYLLLELLP